MKKSHHLSGLPGWPITAVAALGLALIAVAVLRTAVASAQAGGSGGAQASPLHPGIVLLDGAGRPVVESGNPLSTMQTCGSCHDTEFIAGHSFHVSAGLEAIGQPPAPDQLHAWDLGPGLFGRWSPLTYRSLTVSAQDLLDLTTAEWIMTIGARHVGGGPAQRSRSGDPLASLPLSLSSPETSILDPGTGDPVLWDWSQSGTVEMNCFLCHTADPNNRARLAALQSGQFAWANAATLVGTGIVDERQGGFVWNASAFDSTGQPNPGLLQIGDPTNDNCGLCHGLVEDDLEQPLVFFGCRPEDARTVTTGQIISPERLSDTGMNLEDKESLSRAWDVHAERLVECTDCHHSVNNPVYAGRPDESQPAHLQFDPRRLELGEYLLQPSHDFARGGTEADSSMRSCQECHDGQAGHVWLPYQDRHFEVLRCESCHVERIYATAIQQYDWTVLDQAGRPGSICRGLEGEPGDPRATISGFEPVLLASDPGDGSGQLGPYNLISAWYWVYGDPPRPVREFDLRAAWFEGGSYAPEVLVTFDANGDGELGPDELRIDSPRKQALIASRLESLGLEQVHIEGEVQAFPINHTIGESDWAVRDCSVCHSAASRLSDTFVLAEYVPGGVQPALLSDGSVEFSGRIVRSEGEQLFYQPAGTEQGRYVFGRDSVQWVDSLGAFAFVSVLLGVSAHGGLRYMSARRRRSAAPQTRDEYMYGVYERLWHWLQTTAIALLLFTGLIIHKPDVFPVIQFREAVLVHNVLAAILVLNAGLALFYHLASGEIRQYLPRPVGFFSGAVEQASYYLSGIFRGEDHPFEKRPGRKMNPLQQVTYLAILNVLLPLQILTGILMWGAERWPEIAALVGGLKLLAPFHTLIAWLFASFIVAHVYLTTTGIRPLSGMRAMVMGWEEVEKANGEMEATNDSRE